MPTTSPRPIWLAGLTATLIAAYGLLFLMRPASSWPADWKARWEAPYRAVDRTVNRVLYAMCSSPPEKEWVFVACMGVLSGLIPWLATCLLGRHMADMGTRIPNCFGWRLGVAGVLLAIPFLIWMTRSPTIAGPYLNQWHHLGPWYFACYYVPVILLEHWILQGVVIGWCRRDLRWPVVLSHRSDVAGSFLGGPVKSPFMLVRWARWLGLAQPTDGARGGRAVLRWLGIPPGCLFAITMSGLLFGLVHLGKDERELLLSFPGGLAQAWLAVRTNSWLTPCLQHMATGGLAIFFMLLWT